MERSLVYRGGPRTRFQYENQWFHSAPPPLGRRYSPGSQRFHRSCDACPSVRSKTAAISRIIVQTMDAQRNQSSSSNLTRLIQRWLSSEVARGLTQANHALGPPRIVCWCRFNRWSHSRIIRPVIVYILPVWLSLPPCRLSLLAFRTPMCHHLACP